MTSEDILAWLKATGTASGRAGMARYGIPSNRAFGVAMGAMKKQAKAIR